MTIVMRYFLLTAILFCICAKEVSAQNASKNKLYGGVGAGFDYGGIGLKMEYMPLKQLGVFGGVGFNLEGVGYNFGASFKVLPAQRATPVIIGMYGYNAVIKSSHSRIYYGPSFGAGAEVKVGHRKNKLSSYILCPVRSGQFKEDYKNGQKYYGLSTVPLVTISIGFNFALM